MEEFNPNYILPQKLQIREIVGEPNEQRRTIERQVLDNLKTEKELLDLRSESYKPALNSRGR